MKSTLPVLFTVLSRCALGAALLCLLSCSEGASKTTDSPDLPVESDTSEDTSPTESTTDPCLNAGTPGATATCLTPTQTAAYYAEQANRYFDTLDTSADPESMPNYSEWVARWEWPPWLLLTGFGRQDMIDTGKSLQFLDPSTVPVRDCRGFDTQPFARCVVSFEYEGGPCPIYEEFTFNDAGEVTFIEAWSDLPGMRPQSDASDPWGERGTIARLSTRVPGLGTPEGRVDLESSWMKEAAAQDPDVADFAMRAADWWTFWLQATNEAPEDFFALGCGW